MLKPRKIQFLSPAELFALTPGPIKEPICTYINGNDFIRPLSNTINLVLCRNIQKNVQTATELAVGLANKFKDKKVLLVNTYAGQSLMKHTVNMALKRYNLGNDALTNFTIMDIPTSLWDAHKLKRRILDSGVSTVIINSFEFTSMSRSTRYRVAREIIELKDRVDLDLILFSHEMKNDIDILTPARGPMGLISAFAGSVWKLDMPLTPEIEAMIADYTPKIDSVHEQKTKIAAIQLGIENEELGMEGVDFDELPTPSPYTAEAVAKNKINVVPKSLTMNWIYLS